MELIDFDLKLFTLNTYKNDLQHLILVEVTILYTDLLNILHIQYFRHIVLLRIILVTASGYSYFVKN